MKRLSAALLTAGLLFIGVGAAQSGARTFTGVITDSMCALADHSRMKMGPTDAECVLACIEDHGALYVLWDGKDAWTLSDQKSPEKFAGKKVTVTGTPDAKTMKLRVVSISSAK